MLIFGMYRFAPRVLAFRNDYCLACESEHLAFQVRTFNCLHLFWIPAVPLGFWRRWLCGQCGEPPHTRVKTSRFVQGAGLALLAFMSLTFWIEPIEEGDEPLWWIARIGLPLFIAWAIWRVAKGTPSPDLARELEGVQPCDLDECPVCEHELVSVGTLVCPSCGIREEPLGREAYGH